MADDTTAQNIAKNEQYSVRQFSPSVWGGMIGDTMGWWWPNNSLLPAWGTYDCDVALRVMHYTQHNSIWSGAAKVWIEKFIGTPYEISGGKNLTYQWQDIFMESDFGEGYDFMMYKFLTDYLTLNRGGFLERVSFGASDTPIQDGAKILGINHLDALRITYTGNREYPYLYWSEWDNKMHKLHYTRVIHLAESPSPDTRMFGMGKSALYDSISVVNAQVLLGKHQNEMLDDMPPPGIVIFNNVKPEEVETAMKQFDYERQRDGQNVYRAPLQLSALNPNEPATVTFVPLSQVPENFDYEKYMNIHVNVLALTTQLDPQDIWPLQTRVMGSGAQSEVLEMKSNKKGPGSLLVRFERVWNVNLPRPLKWEYKAQNAQQDLTIAQTASTWNEVANTATYMNELEKRQLMANQSPAFADVLLDEQGNVRANDFDTQIEPNIVALPDDVQAAPAPDGAQAMAQDNVTMAAPPTVPNITAKELRLPNGYSWETDGVVWKRVKVATKDIDATMAAYISDMQAAIQDGVDRVTTKAGTAARIRGIITRYGRKAYEDGLEHGGVDASELDDDDLRVIADDNVWDSTYVTNLVKEIFSEAGLKGTPESRAPLWSSTLNRFYYDGIASADKNGMYEFVGDDGVENCATCKALKGQVHRMKEWAKKKLRPGLDHDNFDCGTWEPNCQHYLERTEGTAQGSWV